MLVAWILSLAAAAVSITSNVMGLEIDNALIGMPEIQCNPDTIEMRFKTKKRFMGKIYVQGHYNNPECKVDYGQAVTSGKPVGGIKLTHGACDMDRQRMIQPEGMQFSTVIVISFHPLFVTKVDRAFHIKCLYREIVQTVSQQIEVSAIPTESLQHDMPMPICKYTIHKDELDGPVLKYARVGDQVVHRWECETDMYGMLVHSCYVEDGQGDRYMVIDERGCHKDQVLGDPTYTEQLNLAYRESYVFKFADRVGVRFQCEIRLCVKEGEGCAGVTPPVCDGSLPASTEASMMLDSNATMRKISKRESKRNGPIVDADLISQYVYVLDNDGEEPTAAERQQLAGIVPLHTDRVCLSNSFFLFFVCVFLALASLTVGLGVFFLKRQYRSKSMTKQISPMTLGF